MKWLIVIFFILLAGVSIALIARTDPGYVVIGYGAWKLETTLTLALIALLLGLIAGYYLVRLIINAWTLPRRLRLWQRNRRLGKARTALKRGLILLEEGKWQAAEQTLIQHATLGDSPLLHYLAAARAAQRQDAHERRDDYLRLAHQSTHGADIAIGLTQAELQLSHRQMEQALASLQHLRQLAPKHNYVLTLLMRLYVELRDWGQLLDLLPELRKRKIVSAEQADELEIRAHAQQITLTTPTPTTAGTIVVDTLQQAWERVPKRLRRTEEILISYIHRLRARGQEFQSEVLLREALKKGWSENLMYLYGLVKGSDPAKQLAYAENWLMAHWAQENYAKNPILLLSLGRLSILNRLWGKARAYLESSIGVGPRTETYQELARLLEQMGEPDAAHQCYRKGLDMTIKSIALVAKSSASDTQPLMTLPPKQETPA